MEALSAAWSCRSHDKNMSYPMEVDIDLRNYLKRDHVP